MDNRNPPVYVLGAGFCRDFHPSLFPLATDFLKIAKSLYRYRPDGFHRELSAFISKYFGDETYPDIERVLSFLAAGPVNGRTSENWAWLYDRLVLIIADTLAAASATVAGRRNKASRRKYIGGQPPDDVWDIYSAFVEDLLTQRAVVITFNYDLLLEFLMIDSERWSMSDGYGTNIPLIYDAYPKRLRPSSVPSSRSTRQSACTLLKLHGSINWGFRLTRAAKTAMEVRAVALRAPRLFRLPEDLKYGVMNFQTISVPGTKTVIDFRPFIVPPILDKSLWLGNRVMRSVWKRAAAAVRTTDEITFIGYSLPVTDFMAEFLFRESFRNSPTKQVTVVSPDADRLVTDRFVPVFGPAVEPVSKPFVDWAADKYFARTRVPGRFADW